VIADIEEHVQLSLVGKMTHYTQHIGGTWHVSVDSKFPTVDIRRWYEDSWAGSDAEADTCWNRVNIFQLGEVKEGYR